ncbi:MAG: hypothetical protein N2B03_02565 [Boseongicola sp.]
MTHLTALALFIVGVGLILLLSVAVAHYFLFRNDKKLREDEPELPFAAE